MYVSFFQCSRSSLFMWFLRCSWDESFAGPGNPDHSLGYTYGYNYSISILQLNAHYIY